MATSTPIAPNPMTANVFPWISVPAKFDLFASTSLATPSCPSRPRTYSTPPMTSRLANNIPVSTISLTALALAPGVLNTTIPSSLHASTGILFTPAPALAMANSSGFLGRSCIFALRTIMASGFSMASDVSYVSSNTFRPTGEILFNSFIFILTQSTLLCY